MGCQLKLATIKTGEDGIEQERSRDREAADNADMNQQQSIDRRPQGSIDNERLPLRGYTADERGLQRVTDLGTEK
jgi:hypothetical protein